MKSFSRLVSVFVSLALCSGMKGMAQTNFQVLFNAGSTPLAGSDTVYMYAGVGISGPGDHWGYATGDWVQPGTGLGRMTSLGTNVWSICIDPVSYFSQGIGGSLPAGATLYNIDLKFHRRDKSVVVDKTPTNGDIYISLPAQQSTWEPIVHGDYQNCSLGIQQIEVSNGVLTNYPNPVKESTTIVYSLNMGGEVKLNIMNSLGIRVKQLVNGYRSGGLHSVQWNGVNEKGMTVKDGMYFYNLEFDGKVIQTNKMIVSRN